MKRILLPISALCLLAGSAGAQVAMSSTTNSGGSVYDFSNAEVVTNDGSGVGYQSQNGGAFYHYGPAVGTLTVNGNYNAYALTPATPGVDYFTGLNNAPSGVQIAGNTAPVFGIINLANGNANTFDIINTAGANVGKTANFSNGITTTLRPNASTGALRFLASATYTNTALGDGQYVNGYVTKIGSDAFTFPVGNQAGNDLRTLAISAPATVTDAVSVAYWTGDVSTNIDPTGGAHSRLAINTTPLNGERLSSVSPIGFWDWIATGTDNVTITASLPDQGTATGYYRNAALIRLVGFNTVTNQWELLGNAAATATTEGATVTGNTGAYGRNMSNYSAIGFGYIGGFCLMARAYLEGSLLNNGSATASDGRPLMRDNLRASPYTSTNYIPSNDPYQNAQTYFDITSKYTELAPGNRTEYSHVTSASVFTVTGQNAIVDWVFVELRSKTNSSTVVATRSGLIQRDGDIVDVDGVSCLSFPDVKVDSYYVAVRHRSHLGAMTKNVQTPDQLATLVDLSVTTTALYDKGTVGITNYTGLATNNNVITGYRALWQGDFDANRKVKYDAPNDDNQAMLLEVLLYPSNTTYSSAYNFAYGYFQGDYNMDSKDKYDAPNDDLNLLLLQELLYPQNTTYSSAYDFMIEQLP